MYTKLIYSSPFQEKFIDAYLLYRIEINLYNFLWV